MMLALARRMLTEPDPRALRKLVWNMGVKGVRSVQRYKQRLKRGEHFPPFLFISVISGCQLRCQGCWVDVEAPSRKIELDQLNRIVGDAKAHGNSYFGILGGEPLMHPELFDLFATHPDCYFQLFTNGHLIDDAKAAELRRLGNVTPLVSIEGTAVVSDERRGRTGVLDRSIAGLEACTRNRLVTGVATSVCKTNIDDLVQETWLRRLIGMGVHYAWFHTYRVTGPKPSVELALDPGSTPRPSVHRGDAGEAPDRHRRRLLGRRGAGALSDGDRRQPPHQPLRRHRAVPDHSVRDRIRL